MKLPWRVSVPLAKPVRWIWRKLRRKGRAAALVLLLVPMPVSAQAGRDTVLARIAADVAAIREAVDRIEAALGTREPASGRTGLTRIEEFREASRRAVGVYRGQVLRQRSGLFSPRRSIISVTTDDLKAGTLVWVLPVDGSRKQGGDSVAARGPIRAPEH